MRFTTLCGGLRQTAYLGAHCSHAVHNFIRKHSMIHRCPQIRISVSQCVGSLTSHTSTVRRGLRFIVLIREDLKV